VTKPRNTPRGVRCKDCEAERERRGLPVPANPRPAPYPGPRCASHDRAKKKLSRSGAHERRVQKVYGLQPGQYGQIYLAQGGKCAICQRATGATRNLAVDHDHASGLVRGLLCSTDNKLVGHLRDDPEAALRLYRYLIDPPAKQLGIRAVHEDFRKEEG
jgi:hypothetical protein